MLNSKSAPIFIHGIMKRSGTNFLWQLLLQHPNCHPGSVGEDFLLKNSHLLKIYSEKLFKQWTPKWRERLGNTPDVILSKLGSSLVSLIERPYFLCPREKSFSIGDAVNKEIEIEGKQLVTKTPDVDNLDLFYKLFPHAYLIVIVRDGRSVVESGMKSFGWGFENSTRLWTKAANNIIRFDKAHQNCIRRHLILKYENLFGDTENEVRKVLSFLQLNSDEYNFDKVKTLPIYGSSETLNSESTLHWNPVPKTKTFDPTKRFYSWNVKMHSRFNWIAGKAMFELGYKIQSTQKENILSRVTNVWLDTKYRLNAALHKFYWLLFKRKRIDS